MKREAFQERVERRAQQMQKPRTSSIWFGMTVIGMIGWSVVVPSLAGLALGSWVDAHFAGRVSWRLTLMLGGLALGCANAWRWIDQEWQEVKRKEPDSGTKP